MELPEELAVFDRFIVLGYQGREKNPSHAHVHRGYEFVGHSTWKLRKDPEGPQCQRIEVYGAVRLRFDPETRLYLPAFLVGGRHVER